jgi:hypothetical protein
MMLRQGDPTEPHAPLTTAGASLDDARTFGWLGPSSAPATAAEAFELYRFKEVGPSLNLWQKGTKSLAGWGLNMGPSGARWNGA